MIVRFWSVLCLGVLVASVQSAQSNNENEGNDGGSLTPERPRLRRKSASSEPEEIPRKRTRPARDDDDDGSYTTERSRRRRKSESREPEETPRKRTRLTEGLTTDDLLKIVNLLQASSSKNTPTTNVIPEFDPDNKSQNVERWLRKVNECTAIYNWDEKQTIHYALQKLRGLAKTWYESLPSLDYSWEEWQIKFKRAFPCDVNYGKLLEEMLNRKSRTEETLRDYFYDKLALLSRCEIVGRKAVDCIIYGISDNSIRNGAQALKCEEPEDLLNYLASQQSTQAKDPYRGSLASNSFRKRDFRPNSHNQNRPLTFSKSTDPVCYNCNERGHTFRFCSKPLIKCVKCQRVGHNSENCVRKPLQQREVSDQSSQSYENKVLRVTASEPTDLRLAGKVGDILDSKHDTQHNDKVRSREDDAKIHYDTNNKFYKNVCVNGTMLNAYIDFGSECSLIRYSDSKALELPEHNGYLPIIKGFGNSIVTPKSQAYIQVRIDEVETNLKVLVVDDAYLNTPVLIGQNFTELSSVTVMKDKERLVFYHTPSGASDEGDATLDLYVAKDVIITKGGLVDVYTKESYTGDVYADGSTRMSPNQEHHLHQGCYSINEDIPYLELAEPDEGYHGLIRENETLVEVTPPIRARGPLCSFLILNNKHHGEAPFEIMVIDENEARLRVRYPLNCEKRRNYKFDIAAVGCDGSYSNTVPVHITVTDVNEYAPAFSQAAYIKSVDEGRIYDEILRVEATDRDCTPRYGDVCKYEILSDSNTPFAVDNEGVIRNTEPLDYEKAHNYILSVVAYDCGMMQSAPVMVTIKVNKPCRAGWKGVAERVDYAPGTGPLALFPAARLEACSSDERCPGVTRIQAAVTLQASRAGTGCDRDTYSLHAQRTICGMDAKTIDLLPSPGAGNEWAKSLKPDLGRDGEQMFEFDGETTSAIVPESILPHNLAGSFSISTWMRHAPRPDQDKHRKEHILCLADDHKMNRHHYALFVRNCRLILLLRRDFGEGDLNIFRPAEWRWKIPEVCDNEWHHYAINVRFPNVELVIDGEPYHSPDGKGPEVIDDWPLHPAHGVNTTMVVGACWQGTENDMKHHLHGWLAGLGILRHAVQPAHALKCVARCREGLSLAPDLYLKSVSVEGDGVADVETLLRRVAYGDARAYPTPGRRNVHVATTITCDNGRIIKAKPAESYIMVLQPQTPTILINGSGDAARDYAHFRAGLKVFPELSVHVLSRGGDSVREADSQKLDSCVVSVYPALNPDHEALSLRNAAALPLTYDIRAAVTRDGVILTGADSVASYQEVLREIEYSNKKPAYYLNRVFKLTCSELNGRFTSNEYVQTLTVVHPHMAGGELAHELHPSGVADKMDAVARDKQAGHAHLHEGHQLSPRVYAAHAQREAHVADLPAARLLDIHADQPPANHVALLIGVISCGVIVVLAAVGIARARGPRSRRAARVPVAARLPPNDAEMAWDDSALTITVNPMEEQAAPARGRSADSSDGESDSDSDHHDSSDDDEEVLPSKQHKYRNISQLEWDNSTM